MPISSRTWTDLVHPDDLPRLAEQFGRLFAKEALRYDCECRVRHKEGHWVWVHDHGQVVEWTPHGQPLFVSGVRSDITARKQAEIALRESEEKHRILLEESPDPIFAFSQERRYSFVNRAFASGVGLTPPEITGRRIWDVFSPDEAAKRVAALERVFQAAETSVIEVRVPGPTGDQYYLTTIHPIKDEQGHVLSIICSSKDITERKATEQALAQRTTLLTNLLNSIPDLVFFKDLEGVCLGCNPAYASFLGRKVEEVVGRGGP